MKTLLRALLVLVITGTALGANALSKYPTKKSAVQGRIEITVWPDNGNGYYSIQFRDLGDKIVGEGTGAFGGSNNTIYLERKGGALVGFVFGIPYNLSCSETKCEGKGSSQAEVALKQDSDDRYLDGTLNYEFVHALVSDTEIKVISNGSFEASGQGNGRFHGRGAFEYAQLDPSFDVDIVTEGTFRNIPDPAVFIASVLQSFTESRR